MRACDVKIGEWLEMKEPSDRYGFLKATGIILANQDHSTNWNYTNKRKVPYITIVCEHTTSRESNFGLIKRFRLRDLQKEPDKLGKYKGRNIYIKKATGNQYTIVDYSKEYITAKGNNEYFTMKEKDFLEQYKESL